MSVTIEAGNVEHVDSDVGMIGLFDADAIPNGWFAMNGQTVVGGVALYPTLAAIYPGWVAGADLVLPNWAARYVRAVGGNAAPLGLPQAGATAHPAPANRFTVGVTPAGASGVNLAAGVQGLVLGTNVNRANQFNVTAGEPDLIEPINHHFHTLGNFDAETRPVTAVAVFAVLALPLVTAVEPILSDTATKTVIGPYTPEIDICDIEVGEFDWLDSGLTEYGVAAQSVEGLLGVVTETGGVKEINPMGLLPMLAATLLELERRI